MKRLSLLIVGLLVTTSISYSQWWHYTGSMNEVRWVNNLVVLPNGTVLTAGGLSGNGTNPSGNDTNYIGGGSSGYQEALSSCEIYDPATGKWTETAPMSIARQRHTITSLYDGRVVVTGGQITGNNDPAMQTNSIEIFDPTNQTWSNGGSLVIPRQNHTATLLLDSTILITGGYNGDILSSCEIYNPRTQTSRVIASMHEERHDHQTTLLPTGEVLVEGGRIGGSDGIYLNECEIYNPVNNTWRVIDSMAQPRTVGCLTTFSDGTTLAAGGRNSPISCAPGSEILDPVTFMWSNTDPMKQPVHWPASILMPHDRFITTGGLTDADFQFSNNVTATPTCEWYDKDDKVWYYAPRLEQSRCKHAAAYIHQTVCSFLPVDMLLVAGGLTGNNTYTNSCEVLDVGIGALADYKANQNSINAVREPDLTAPVFLSVLGNVGNSPTAIFSLNKSENVKLDIINSEGTVVAHIADQLYNTGAYSMPLNVSGLSNGAYFVRLTSLSGNVIARMLIIK